MYVLIQCIFSGTTETIPSLDGHNIIIVHTDYLCLKHLLLIPLESSFDRNILPFFLGNVHVYRNGRMHFAHHNRQERREQQRDVREMICSGFLQFLHQLM